jgi:maltooligosyltrehalose trehalohydrolase
VRRGRRQEFAAFPWQGGSIEAHDEDAFLHSKLDQTLRHQEPHRTLLEFYREAIKLRRNLPSLSECSREHMQVHSFEVEGVLQVRRWSKGGQALVLANFSDEPRTLSCDIAAGKWHQVLDSAAPHWRGPGSSLPDCFQSAGAARLNLRPKSIALFQRQH